MEWNLSELCTPVLYFQTVMNNLYQYAVNKFYVAAIVHMHNKCRVNMFTALHVIMAIQTGELNVI